ncbi:MAG: hypothetical protein J7M16_03410 [Anaerolineae bacterium]|nr:hypothetical protein [Anaerolineae bacterium]
MDFVKILKRSFAITLRYRALWLFGFILALAGGGGGRGFSPGGSGNYSGGNGGGPARPTPDHIPYPGGPHWPEVSTILLIIVALVIFVALLAIVLMILRVLARTALIGMVDEVEETEQTSVRSGFRILWSRRGLNLLLIEALTAIAWIIVAPAMVITALLPGALVLTGNVVLIVGGVLAAGILLLIVIAILTIVGVAFSMVMEIVRRECVLGEKGVLESIRDGILTVRYHLADVGLMWLLMTGISIAWSIVMIPAGIICLILGLLIGGPPALLAYALFHSWMAAVVIGAPLFLITMILPLAFVNGLYLVFQSSAWTLTYREFRAQEMAPVEDEIQPAPPVSTESNGDPPAGLEPTGG